MSFELESNLAFDVFWVAVLTSGSFTICACGTDLGENVGGNSTIMEDCETCWSGVLTVTFLLEHNFASSDHVSLRHRERIHRYE